MKTVDFGLSTCIHFLRIVNDQFAVLRLLYSRAYIPPECKSSRVGQDYQPNHFALPIPTCRYPKRLASLMQTIADPTQTMWNIVCLGYARVGFVLGM